MQEIKILTDSELGDIIFRKNMRARRYIIRLRDKKISVTIPLSGNYTEAKQFFLENRKALIQKIQTTRQQPTPSPTPLHLKIDEVALKQRAQSFLPCRLTELASLHGFKYNAVRIRKSRTRWGSCSSKKMISLSFYLMLLPDHLIVYVLLHELCHTVHLNHGPAFWELLNKCTQNKAWELRAEIRKYHIPAKET